MQQHPRHTPTLSVAPDKAAEDLSLRDGLADFFSKDLHDLTMTLITLDEWVGEAVFPYEWTGSDTAFLDPMLLAEVEAELETTRPEAIVDAIRIELRGRSRRLTP